MPDRNDHEDDSPRDQSLEGVGPAEDRVGPGVFVPPPLQFGIAVAAGEHRLERLDTIGTILDGLGVSIRIASHGHASTQRPHTTQRSSSISNTAGFFSMPLLSVSAGMIVMQCAGHTVGQHMQATQRTAPSSRGRSDIS